MEHAQSVDELEGGTGPGGLGLILANTEIDAAAGTGFALTDAGETVGRITVKSVQVGSPAASGLVQEGDELISIGGRQLRQYSVHWLARLLLAPAVEIGWHRRVTCPSVTGELRHGITGYVRGATHDCVGASAGKLVSVFPAFAFADSSSADAGDGKSEESATQCHRISGGCGSGDDPGGVKGRAQALWPIGLTRDEFSLLNGGTQVERLTDGTAQEPAAPGATYIFAFNTTLFPREGFQDSVNGSNLQELWLQEEAARRRLGVRDCAFIPQQHQAHNDVRKGNDADDNDAARSVSPAKDSKSPTPTRMSTWSAWMLVKQERRRGGGGGGAFWRDLIDVVNPKPPAWRRRWVIVDSMGFSLHVQPGVRGLPGQRVGIDMQICRYR